MVLICMFVQINAVFACYGLFFLNRKVIAESLCEKKTRNCCGHCFLQKKVAQASSSRQEDSTEHPVPKSLDEYLSLIQGVEPENRHSLNVSIASRKFEHSLICTLCKGSLPGIDHPPKA
jgi:hypothetical protein